MRKAPIECYDEIGINSASAPARPSKPSAADLSKQLRSAADRPTMPSRPAGSVLVHADLLRVAADEIDRITSEQSSAASRDNISQVALLHVDALDAAYRAADGVLPYRDKEKRDAVVVRNEILNAIWALRTAFPVEAGNESNRAGNAQEDEYDATLKLLRDTVDYQHTKIIELQNMLEQSVVSCESINTPEFRKLLHAMGASTGVPHYYNALVAYIDARLRIAGGATPIGSPMGKDRQSFDFDDWFNEHSEGAQLRIGKELCDFKTAIETHYAAAPQSPSVKADLSASGLLKMWKQAELIATDTMPAPFQFAKLLLATDQALPPEGNDNINEEVQS
jgi:hypothetical protein